jgi:heme-degrading monooxygenase HmoA
VWGHRQRGTPVPASGAAGRASLHVPRGGCARRVAQLGWGIYAAYMIVVTNRIPVAEGHQIDFEDRFRKRVHLVDQAQGFVRNEVHRPRPMKFDHTVGSFVPDPDKQGYYEVKTWWLTLEDFTAWTRSPAFAEAHNSRPPKEMFAGPSILEIHEVMESTDLTL